MFKKPAEVLDFKSFIKGEYVVTNINEMKRYERKKKVFKTVIRVGTVAVVLLTTVPIPHSFAESVTAMAETHAEGGETWEKLVGGLVKLLDPVAKIFGIVAGIAIMTGNGKIGLERLFWLSLGYLTARKVEAWIEFLNTL